MTTTVRKNRRNGVMKMTDKYIKREDVIERLTNLMQLQAVTARAIVEAIPAADVVERKHGKWIVLKDCSNSGIYCSVCNTKVFDFTHQPKKKQSRFCPNCGAEMIGGNDDV